MSMMMEQLRLTEKYSSPLGHINDFLIEKIVEHESIAADPQRQNLERLRKRHNGNRDYSRPTLKRNQR